MRFVLFAGFSLAVLLAAPAARAQVDVRYAEEPTGGLVLPTTPLAGEHDARTVVANPGGLALLRGGELALAYDRDDTTYATSSGQGFGVYAAQTFGGKLFIPKLAIGYGLEWIRPPRSALAPDPGEPFRLTIGWASTLGPNVGFGVAWHHFIEDGALSGVDAFDAGLSSRFGAHLAIGATLRDIATRTVGGAPVQRRYELETLVRPLGTDALELAIGGRVGETRGDLAGWARASVRVARGVYVLAEAQARDLHEIVTSPTGTRDVDTRESRATLGMEISFGRVGLTALGTGVRADGGSHALGGTLVARFSTTGPASVIGPRDHIERVELAGEIGVRQLTALVGRLRAIARDPSAKALVVTFDGPTAGWATFEELRDEISAVRRAHKKVFAYMVSGAGREYFVASAADQIYLDPAGGLRLVGMTATTLYFRGVLDLLGVVPEFVKIAEYKSAPEQFTETAPTEAAARMHHDLWDSLWEHWVAAVAEGRHLSPARVQELVDGGPYTAGDLAKMKELVDAVAPPDKVSELVVAELGGAYPVEQADPDRPDRWERPGVAVIYVDGDITDGESKTIPIIGEKLAGGQTIVASIAAARADPRVGAIVLRIDSPGGSAVASELISREVFATRGVKPILCSMGNLAASGGYFVAAGCDQIYAEPMTITGSIGIFTGKVDLSGLLKRVGVTTDTYTKGKRSGLESMYKPYNDDERAAVMNELRYMYSRFVGAVADGRKLTKTKVDDLGRGHVYTGAQAKPLSLVDRFGGIGDAIAEAKRQMHLDPDTRVDLLELPKQPASLLGTLGTLIGADSQDKASSLLDLPLVRQLLREVPASMLVAPDVPQERLPFEIEIR
jgi:protease-4